MDEQHTLEKLRISERLQEVETEIRLLKQSIDSNRELFAKAMERVGDIAEECREILYSQDGGLVTKVDHIKGIRDDLLAHGARDLWIQGIILAAILGMKFIK